MNAPLNAALPASDMARAKDWYLQHLGLTPVEESSDGAAHFEIGGVQFTLYQSSFAGTNQATAAAFRVADFDATMSELRGNGVVFEDYDLGDGFATVDGVITTPDGFRGAWFKDSEGNIIGVAERT